MGHTTDSSNHSLRASSAENNHRLRERHGIVKPDRLLAIRLNQIARPFKLALLKIRSAGWPDRSYAVWCRVRTWCESRLLSLGRPTMNGKI